MKKTTLFLLAVISAVLNISAQTTKELCTLGVTFEISNNPSWGYGEPVILSVEPFSPADKAGLKVDDIIMEVNGSATYLRNYPTIENWLTEGFSSDVKLTIRNVDTYFKEYLVNRDCAPANAVSEFDLASAYSFYSIESTNERAFSIPLKVAPNKEVNYSDYRTFSFVDNAKTLTALDVQINNAVQKALEGRGLVRSDKDPDILVQTYYTYQPNLKYDFSSAEKTSKTWRFDTEKEEMIQLPILSAEDPSAELKGKYVLELGIRFFDKKYVDPEKLTQIWDCQSREFLTENYSLEEYANIHAPLIMLQYPFSSAKTIAKYVVSFKKFNYTGLNYDPQNTGLVLAVDNDSPAYLAGIKPGDKITKINKTKFDFTPQEMENGYRRFIVSTMNYRDPRTKFINATGFPDCMYWSKSNFQLIKEAFSTPYYATSFSYLYAFEKYISDTNVLEVEYKDNKSKKKARLNPIIQSSIVVKAL